MNRKPYPQYKASGVEWLGDVPAHWEVKPLFSIADESKTKNIDMIEDNLLSLSYGKIIKKDITSNFGLLPESFDTYQIVEKGDIILRLTDLQNDQRSLRVGLAIERGIITSAYVNIRTSCFFSNLYFFYLMYNIDVQKIFYNYGGGVRQSMRFDDLRWLPILSPPLSEQKAITAFLDRETGRIDTLVAKKKRLVELLREKRTALISRTVTKGLDLTVKMKPSGVEWLGDVPAHWEVKPLRYMFENLDKKRIPLSSEERGDLEKIYPYYGASGIIDYVDNYIFDITLILVAEDGANLLSRSTPLAFRAENKYWVNNHAHILKPKYDVITYWESLLKIFDYTPYVSGSAQPKLTSENLGAILLPLPPLSEQQEIASFLDRETGKIDALIGKVETAVEKLKEYRISLISAVVTGKIDVTYCNEIN